MKTQQIPENFNSAFVNVTLSAARINGKYAVMDLLKAASGDWVMAEESASKIKYLYPVRKNEILGVFEVTSFQMVNKGDQPRVRFTLKPIYQGSTKLLENAINHITSTNYVVKYF